MFDPGLARGNLRLDVRARRADGYHELRTIFQSLTLHDSLRLALTRGPAIELRVEGNPALAAAPARDNLVYRALSVLRDELKLRRGVAVTLRKRVPAGRGLGGGSRDAPAGLA